MDSKCKTLPSGHTYEKVSGEEYERQSRDFTAYKVGFLKLSPGAWYLPLEFPKYSQRLYNFEFRPTDVLVMTYPKMGTTFTQELIWTMRNNPDLDNDMGNLPLSVRSPFLERDPVFDNELLPPPGEDHPYFSHFQKLCPGKDIRDGLMLQLGEMGKDPRTLKTHLPLSLYKNNLLEKVKVVYVVRNPKDGVVSYFHHSRIIKCHGYVGTLDQFVQYFVDDELMFSPYWEHIREAWSKRDHPNMHFIFYEDLVKNTECEVRKLAKFINLKLTDQQIQNVLKQSSFDKMKNSTTTHPSGEKRFEKVLKLTYNMDIMKKEGGFFRKGQVGSWKEVLSPANEKKIDEWTKKNSADLGITFKYE